ncbi:MAG: hypothetical protein GKR93_10705 [Gammaproteobacteria bacterium]|nr:hypothetical protein [Gammaproteobacteria bacterium]
MIHEKYKGLDPISIKIAAFLLAGIEDEDDPAVFEHIQKLLGAVDDEELPYIEVRKIRRKRNVRSRGIESWVQGGRPKREWYEENTESVVDWVNSKVYRGDVEKVYSKDNASFFCEGISNYAAKTNSLSTSENPHKNQSVDDSSLKLTKRENQKLLTEKRNTKIQERMNQLAKEKKNKGESFNKKSLATEISKLPEYIGVDEGTVLRITKATWKK